MDLDGVEVLSEQQCRWLLGQERVGRVAVSVSELAVVFPVNYSVVSDEILFFTGEGTKLEAAIANARVTFEVDRVDPFAKTGWSVLIVALAREVTEPIVVLALRSVVPARARIADYLHGRSARDVRRSQTRGPSFCTRWSVQRG